MLTTAALPSCATTHAVRWAYGMPSICPTPDRYEEEAGLRAASAPVSMLRLYCETVLLAEFVTYTERPSGLTATPNGLL